MALFDTDDRGYSPTSTVPLWEEGRIAIGFRGGCQPPDWDALVRREEKKGRAESRRLLYVACTRARDLLVIPRPPVDADVGGFWKELVDRLPAASDADVRVVDAETLARPEVPGRGRELWALASAEGGDAVAARWEAERKDLLVARRGAAVRAGLRHPPRGADGAPARGGGRRRRGARLRQPRAPPPRVDAARGRGRGARGARARDGGGARARPSASTPRPPAAPRRRWSGPSACPVIDRARRAPRVWRELSLWFPDGAHLVEGIVDLVFEEDGQLVVVDYKSDAIAADAGPRPGRAPRAAAAALRPRPRAGGGPPGARAARPLHRPRPHGAGLACYSSQ